MFAFEMVCSIVGGPRFGSARSLKSATSENAGKDRLLLSSCFRSIEEWPEKTSVVQWSAVTTLALGRLNQTQWLYNVLFPTSKDWQTVHQALRNISG